MLSSVDQAKVPQKCTKGSTFVLGHGKKMSAPWPFGIMVLCSYLDMWQVRSVSWAIAYAVLNPLSNFETPRFPIHATAC